MSGSDAGSDATSGASSAPKPGSPAASKLAEKHFQKALERYRKGAYREAIAELNQAIALDPHGKDLYYNRGLVYEKLGQIDDAIREFEHYLRMVKDPEQQKRARAIIRRLKGARREVETPAAEAPRRKSGTTSSTTTSAQPAAASTHPAGHGRLDRWVYFTGGVAAAAVVLGSIFGIRALATEPGVDASTGGGRSYSRMQDDQSRAHSYAVVADVSFVVGIVSGAAAGALYFMRSPAQADTARAMPLPSRPLPAPGFSWRVRF